MSRRLDDDEIVERIIEKGKCVYKQEWDGGASPAANGFMSVYRWRGRFAFEFPDVGSDGPFGSWEEVLKAKGDDLFGVTSATEYIWCSLMTAEEIAARLTYYDDVEHFPIRLNGETWGYNKETGKFDPWPDEEGEQEE
jgi:hypothetical protein